jgi:hypothetical protein
VSPPAAQPQFDALAGRRDAYLEAVLAPAPRRARAMIDAGVSFASADACAGDPATLLRLLAARFGTDAADAG